MEGNFPRCLAVTLIHEGGWVDHKDDPGGATMMGVTLARFQQHVGGYASKADLRAITDDQLQAIYRTYWAEVRGDDLPAGMDLVAFDAAVNSGASRGARWLQEALGVSADGKVGPNTVRAARMATSVSAVIDRACDRRMSFLKGLKTWPTFGRGWASRVSDIRARAKAMASDPHPIIPPVSVPPAPAPAVRSIWQAIIDLLKGVWK